MAGTGTDATEHPPGWYADPDPRQGGRLSYWDGQRWTGQHRPRPSWQAADGDAVAAADREARRRLAHGPRSWILAGGVLALIVFLAWVTLPKPDHPGPKVLADARYASAANAECRSTIIGLRPKIDSDPSSNPALDAVAREVDGGADGMTALAARLRAIPAAAADQPHIAGWLAGWDRYASIGHDYATALRTNDTAAQVRLSKDGDKVQKATDRFARANGINRCQFFIVPRGTGTDPFSGGQ